MRILGIDLSTKSGYAVGDDSSSVVVLGHHGLLALEKNVLEYHDFPYCYLRAAADMAERVFALVAYEKPDLIVIEETNLGKNRYSQKTLEYIHCQVLQRLESLSVPVIYLSSSIWRQNLGLTLTKEQKKANAALAKAKRAAAARGLKVDKKALGIKGKVTKKHVALAYANERFGLALKVKDNDVGDAICLVCAAFNNAVPCDGT